MLCVETIRTRRVDDGDSGVDVTMWKEDAGDTKHVVLALRVYTLLLGEPASQTIGELKGK